MSANNPNGSEIDWVNGEPFQGIKNNGDDVGTITYWLNGVPEMNLFPNGSSGNFMFLFD